jgi:hypothetical protein
MFYVYFCSVVIKVVLKADRYTGTDGNFLPVKIL